ncbi:MAG: bi-domain-containing oxidoreductase [Phycisphaerae bacterium]|nr:bi-domain-containing oxidoreductase [Phycisphaerae bacterium]
MKQILQNLRNGILEIAELPCPPVRPGHLLIQTTRTLISAGTERMLVEFGKAGLIAKARSQPDKVRQVLDKIRTDGLLPTLEAVFNRLDEPLPLGYCNAGRVLEVGAGVTGYSPGDRVASNGPHAEIVCVPKNLCAKIPEGVDDEAAAFTVLSSIGLQGIRLVQPAMGERIVVFGLGLIGLVTVQLLRASGCDVLGVDVNAERLRTAEGYGARTASAGEGGDPVAAAGAWTEGRGVDGVIVTASAKTDEIMHQAAQMCRKRGRIVLVGVVGLNLRRADFYDKELTFQVSCSYGAGRYDESYEQAGQDYPLGYVRWTEQRNFEAVLGAMRSGGLKVADLITHRYALADAAAAYQIVSDDRSALGVVLEYPAEVRRETRLVSRQAATSPAGKAVIGVIGAGNFSKMTMMPALAKAGIHVSHVADLNAAAARHLANKFNVPQAVTDYKLVLDDERVNGVMIAVGHNIHARFVCESLAAGKHVFVEKPLAMNVNEVLQVLDAHAKRPDLQVMVGFNRRFSPHSTRMRELLANRGEPLAVNMTVNAGFIPPEHWVQDPVRGGGRIIGEGCHFIDLLMSLAGSPVRTVSAAMMGAGTATREDKMSITLGFEDGSVGTVNYFANGSKTYPKELLEVFSQGRVLHLDNFRRMTGYGFKGFSRFKTARQDKGHEREFLLFAERIAEGGTPLIPLAEIVNVTLASFAAMTAAAESRTIVLSQEYADVYARLSGLAE